VKSGVEIKVLTTLAAEDDESEYHRAALEELKKTYQFQ